VIRENVGMKEELTLNNKEQKRLMVINKEQETTRGYLQMLREIVLQKRATIFLMIFSLDNNT